MAVSGAGGCCIGCNGWLPRCQMELERCSGFPITGGGAGVQRCIQAPQQIQQSHSPSQLNLEPGTNSAPYYSVRIIVTVQPTVQSASSASPWHYLPPSPVPWCSLISPRLPR